MNNITKSELNPFDVKGVFNFGNLRFRKKSLFYTLLGATLVIASVVLAKSNEKVASGLYLLGWLVIAFSVAESGRHTMLKNVLVFGAVAGIVYSTMIMKNLMDENQPVHNLYPSLFIGSWLLLGYTVGMGWGGFVNYHTMFGLLAGVMAILSTSMDLPWLRTFDRKGLPMWMFIGAWVLLTFGNSLLPN